LPNDVAYRSPILYPEGEREGQSGEGTAQMAAAGLASKDAPFYPCLVVDDDRDHGHAVVEVLGDMGWQATWVEGGPQAIEYLQQVPHCVVLCDYNMPGMNGIDLLSN